MKPAIYLFLLVFQSELIAQDLQPVSNAEEALADTPMLVDDNQPVAEAQSEEIDWDSNNQENKDNYDQISIRDIVEPNVDYRYAAFDVPDPFVPPVVTPPAERKEADAVVALSQFQLSALQVVGIWEISPGVRKAFVKAGKNGNGVTLVVGDSIGSEGGEVVNIEPDHIRVREFRLSEDGTRQFRDTIKRLGSESLSSTENSTPEAASNSDRDTDEGDSATGMNGQGLTEEPFGNLASPVESQAPEVDNQAPVEGGQNTETPVEIPSNSGGIISI